MKISYYGHSFFKIKGKDHTILIDPFITGNPSASCSVDDFAPDAVLVTHGHGDHLGDAIPISKKTGSLIIAPYELAMYCQNQGANVHPMHIGGTFDFEFGRVKLTIAHHGSMTPDGKYAGNPCGFLLTMDNMTIYHAGDTGLFYDMKLIGEINKIDIAMLPIGGNFTMDRLDAVRAVKFLRPRHVIPIHFNTFDMIKTDVQAFVKDINRETDSEPLYIEFNTSIDI